MHMNGKARIHIMAQQKVDIRQECKVCIKKNNTANRKQHVEIHFIVEFHFDMLDLYLFAFEQRHKHATIRRLNLDQNEHIAGSFIVLCSENIFSQV